MATYQRGVDGYPVGADTYMRTMLGPIPEAKGGLFQDFSAGFSKPAEIRGWQWSVTHGRWGAVVRFSNSQELVFTWPKLY
jgi:hypothetical protein